jgi:hypothetical protein
MFIATSKASRVMMEQTRHLIEVVASETGFADRGAPAACVPAGVRAAAAGHAKERGSLTCDGAAGAVVSTHEICVVHVSPGSAR